MQQGERSAQNRFVFTLESFSSLLHQGMTDAPKFVAPHAYPNREVATVCCRPEAGAGQERVKEHT